MFKRIEGKIVNVDEDFSIESLGRVGIKYTQRDKSYYVDSELLTGQIRLVIWENSIRPWHERLNRGYKQKMEEKVTQEILENIRRAFEWEGTKIEISP